MTNQNAKHTPGPWKYESKDIGGKVPCYKVYGADNLEVATVGRHDGKGDLENARLIAGAPRLLVLLERIHSEVRDYETAGKGAPVCALTLEQIEKLIDKVQGRI